MTMEKGTRTRLTTVFILLLVLATGSVLGVAVDRRLEARATSAQRLSTAPEGSLAGEGAAEGGEEGSETPRRRRLVVEQVGLTQSQQVQVDSIVASFRQQTRSLEEELRAELREAYMPLYRELVAETRTKIKSVLDEGQRMAYDSLLADHDRRREERRTRDSVPEAGGQGGA